MFYKRIKNKFILFLALFICFPWNVLAYSDYIIASGANIGIELNSKGIMVVGTYKIGNDNPAREANIQNGDMIIKINNHSVTSIEEMLNIIENDQSLDNLKITYLRGNNQLESNLKLIKDDDNIYKTGLYVKDSITGIGTLTYIDPQTKIYGALGHEIIEKSTGQRLEIKDGKIYNSEVTGITKSTDGEPGEKNARYYNEEVFGTVLENSASGIFGTYTDNIDKNNLYKVSQPEEITLGAAEIRTVINEDNIETFKINILKIFNNSKSTKNILFEVTDQELLDKTGGIIQGMSGSPIIQDDKIIGAVTHVVVDDPTKGYGVFITTMLEEGEN